LISIAIIFSINYNPFYLNLSWIVILFARLVNT
jgi:hypothetical protein